MNDLVLDKAQVLGAACSVAITQQLCFRLVAGLGKNSLEILDDGRPQLRILRTKLAHQTAEALTQTAAIHNRFSLRCRDHVLSGMAALSL